MYLSCVPARIALALMLAASLPDRVGAQEGPPPDLSAKTLIEAARAALAQSRLEDAELLLDGVKRGEGDIDELDFLYGTIALARGGWEAAIARFRAILARDPTLVRVRLDLARAYFRAGRDGNAAHHFRQALWRQGPAIGCPGPGARLPG